MFLFSSTFFNLWNTFRIALLTSSSASPIIISGSVSIDWLFMLAVGCFFSGFVFLFPMRQSVVFWRYCLLPHVLGGFSSLARGNRSFLAYVSSGDCSTYFFSVFFSTALVFFRTHEHTSTEPDSADPWDAASVGSLLCFASSSLNSDHRLLHTARPLVSVWVSHLWAGAWKLSAERRTYWVHFVPFSFPGLLSRALCVQCLENSYVIYFV